VTDVSHLDTTALARELADAYANRRIISTPPTARGDGFDIAAGYAVEAELARMRRAAGHATVGRKIGFANKALWRVHKMETLVWAHMYDDTVREAGPTNAADLPVGRMTSPRIEPEIVFKLARPFAGGDAAAALEAVEWLALGFEIIDCVYADWKFQPADFLAAYGLHAGLIVGEPRPVAPADVPALVDALATFTVTLTRNGQVAAEGGGKNVLRSPALCLAEVGSATAAAAMPLEAGELISTGALTEYQPIATGQTWTAALAGLDLPELTVHTIA
jgi:2-oxo-3-hexenedioate decarboxylase